MYPNPNGLGSLTLDQLPTTHFGVQFGANSNNGTLVGYLGTMPYTTTNTVTSWMPVYAYAK
jgi:hypothetical protein